MTQSDNDRTDAQIQDDVSREMYRDARVDETEVESLVEGGRVILTGVVDDYAQKLASEDAAQQVAGVMDVVNNVQVEVIDGSAKLDIKIAQTVRRALAWDALVRQENIAVTVEDGHVALEGSALYATDSRYAELVARDLPGVRGVTNSLTVTHGQSAPDHVRRSIEEALERRAKRQSRRIRYEAGEIWVEVKDGQASLSGEVATWDEKKAALGAAARAPGVHAVEDNLQIRPAS